MKKIFYALAFLLLISLTLSGCSLSVPSPEIKEGEFNVSVSYEQDGQTKTLDLVYTCKYDGAKWSAEGTRYRAWDGHFLGYGDGEVIDVLVAEDGARIVLAFLIYPEYFMGEPDYINDFYPHVLVNRIYYLDGVEMIDDNQELIYESYGVRVIGCEYDKPIENSFK